jgi:hypothetical protein
MRKTLLLAAIQLAFVAATAAPAFAHGGGGPDATNFRSIVRQVSQAGPDGEPAGPARIQGLSFRVLANDALLELENRSGREVTIFGYSDDPYLRIGPEGVFQNVNSPATYINRERFGQVEVPADISASAPPEWERVSEDASFAWHDHRIHWMSQAPPPQVAANGETRTIEIFDWSVPFRVEDQGYAVAGTLSWIRPASPLPWLLGGLVATSLPLLAGFGRPAGEERKFVLKRTFALVLAALVVVDIVHSVDDIIAVPATLAQNIGASLQSGLFIAVGAYGAWMAWKAGGSAWIGILLGAFGLALGIGATHLISLTSSQLATELPPGFTRFVIAANVAVLVPAGLLAWLVHERMVVESKITP